jgi:uncharacterized protein DUF1580
MIDVRNENLLPCSEVARETPGEPPHASTVRYWRVHGIRGVKLETVMIGGRRYTSKEALQRFFAATTAAANGEMPGSATGGVA